MTQTGRQSILNFILWSLLVLFGAAVWVSFLFLLACNLYTLAHTASKEMDGV
jgi:hypothetical protein